ncbi:MAG: DUF2141 domain-containing protein, partial [Proteobacteria bacterium]
IYAIAIMHDEDGDHKLKTVMGIPREGFGFSNNPRVMVGAPKFEKTAVNITGAKTDIPITVKYFM